MKKDPIEHIISSFSGKRILIIGDVMVDTYLTGNVERISPESPVPVVDIKGTEHRLGGAANVALNIRSLGAEPFLCSVIGKDPEGDIYFQLMQKRGLETEGIIFSPDRHTTVKTRIFCRNHQMIRFDRESTNDLHKEDTMHLLGKIYDLLEKYRFEAVILQDYNKGILTEEVIKKVIEHCREKNIFIAVDPKKKNFFCYKGATFFKPNLREITDSLHLDIDSRNKADLDKAAEELVAHLENKITFITLSERGIYIRSNGKSEIIPAKVRHVADVSGAGDTVISIATLALAAGLPAATAAQLANIAGGIVCEEVGVIPVDKDRLIEEAADIF